MITQGVLTLSASLFRIACLTFDALCRKMCSATFFANHIFEFFGKTKPKIIRFPAESDSMNQITLEKRVLGNLYENLTPRFSV